MKRVHLYLISTAGLCAVAAAVWFLLTRPPPPLHPARPAFLGAAECARCHLENFEQWRRTSHARSMQEALPGAVKGDFTLNNTYTYRGVTSTMSIRDGRYTITAPGADGVPETHEVLYTIGDRDTQWYIARLPGGHLQILPAYYDLNANAWYHPVEGIIESESGNPFTPLEPGHWTNFGRTWNSQCFDCHASQIQINYDPVANTYASSWVDLSINCEACHGAGSDHVDFWEKAVHDPNLALVGDTTLVDLNALTPAQSVEVCAQCHATKRILQLGYRPGDKFYDFYEPLLLDSEDVWPDGRYRTLTYNYTAFSLSPCHTEGELTCLGCHPAHTQKEDSAEYDRICLRCHNDPIGLQPQRHSHHSSKVTCIACHMPHLPEVRRIRVVDHRISVPVPENTVRFGIPNACADCHADRSPEWAAEWTRTWWGKQDDRVAHAAAIAIGRRGDPRALEPLIRRLSNTSLTPPFRASAAALLGRYRSPGAVQALIHALDDPHPLIRAKAVQSIGETLDPRAAPALAHLLNDPAKVVRMALVPALEALGTLRLSDRDLARYKSVFSEYERTVARTEPDNPSVLTFLGRAYQRRRNPKAAERAFRTALTIWPGTADAAVGLASFQSRRGQFREAVQTLDAARRRNPQPVFSLEQEGKQVYAAWTAHLKRALQSNPQSVEAHNDLATVYAFQGMAEQAVREYRAALELRPDYAPALYNLGFIHHRTGSYPPALAAFERYLQTAEGRSDSTVRALVENLRQEIESGPGKPSP